MWRESEIDIDDEVVKSVYYNHYYLHNKVWRFNFGRSREVLQNKVVRLLQPQVYATQRLVVEGPDSQEAQIAVVNVQHLKVDALRLSLRTCVRGEMRK